MNYFYLKQLYEMPACRSVDIDEELDMFVVEQILEGKWENWKGGPQWYFWIITDIF